MTSIDPKQTSPAFVGREAELTVIAASAEAAITRRPWLIWVEGAAGSGKTSLLRRALADLPEQFITARVNSDELATDIPYQLASRFGAVSGDGPFAVGQELLDAWSRLQERGPAAVVIEDLHWADPASSMAVLSAIKRLEGDRLVVIVTSRLPPGESWDGIVRDEDRCRRLALRAFDSDDVQALADLNGINLTSREAERLWRHTGGHPIWVRTLLAELTLAELQAPDGELPAPRTLASAVIARLAELPAASQRLAAALAVVNYRTPLSVVGRVAGMSTPLEALEGLLTTGFVRFDRNEAGSPVEFSHPLYRLAIYEDLSPTRRRDLHRSAARVLAAGAVMAHRVAAADGADDFLAEELEKMAISERDAGAATVAARDFLWASSLSGDPELSERRLLEAALAFMNSGQLARAAALRPQLQLCRVGPTRNLILGLVDWDLGNASEAEQWFLQAVTGEPTDLEEQSVTRALAQMAEIHVMAGRPTEAVEAAQRALSSSIRDTVAERLAHMHLAFGEAMLKGGWAGLDRINTRLPLDSEQVARSDVDLLVARASIAYYSGRTVEALNDLRAVFSMVKRGTVPVQLARCHYLMGALLTHSGEWDDALVHARTALSVATDDRLVWIESQCHSLLGTLLAYRGEWQNAEVAIGMAGDTALHSNTVEAVATSRIAKAALARSTNLHKGVIELLSDLSRLVPMLSGLYFVPSLISALIDTGNLDEARLQIGELERMAAERRIDFESRLLGLRANLAGRTAQPDEATELFDAAMAKFGPADPFLDRALLHHSYGKVLLAHGNRRSAVDQLRTARDLLSSVGAEPFVVRVDDDLALSGLQSPDRSNNRSTLDLTNRERDVAFLVSRGFTNPEVASQLYVSRKAVEYHLSNIYAKLGISGRSELRNISLPA
jgi:ATP/maltotriose-dependent transcriptional regulator MalT